MNNKQEVERLALLLKGKSDSDIEKLIKKAKKVAIEKVDNDPSNKLTPKELKDFQDKFANLYDGIPTTKKLKLEIEVEVHTIMEYSDSILKKGIKDETVSITSKLVKSNESNPDELLSNWIVTSMDCLEDDCFRDAILADFQKEYLAKKEALHSSLTLKAKEIGCSVSELVNYIQDEPY